MPSNPCKSCGQVKPESLFPVNRRNPTGRDARCKDCCAAKTRKWRAENPDRAREAERRAAVLKATPRWLTPEHRRQIQNFYEQAQEMTAAGETKYAVDHIVPLKGRGVCGLHAPWNLQILPASVNQSKWVRYDPDQTFCASATT